MRFSSDDEVMTGAEVPAGAGVARFGLGAAAPFFGGVDPSRSIPAPGLAPVGEEMEPAGAPRVAPGEFGLSGGRVEFFTGVS